MLFIGKYVEFGCENLTKLYSPYCWFKDQTRRSIALRTIVVAVAKTLVMYRCSKVKSGDEVMARENIPIEDCLDKLLPIQLHENLDQFVEQLKAWMYIFW